MDDLVAQIVMGLSLMPEVFRCLGMVEIIERHFK
jgi:hypothetical protein